MSEQKTNTAWGELIARCWKDESFKQSFLADPAKIMADNGMAVEAGVAYKVLECTDKVFYAVLPADGIKESVQVLAKGLLHKASAGERIVPEGAEIRLVQNNAAVQYIVLPPPPAKLAQPLSAADLDKIAGGDVTVTATNVTTVGEATVVTMAVEAHTVTTTGLATAESHVAVVAFVF